MASPGGTVIGGGMNPLGDALKAPGQGLPEHLELADSPEGRRIEQKLRAEALARRRGDDDDAALLDPTGHA